MTYQDLIKLDPQFENLLKCAHIIKNLPRDDKSRMWRILHQSMYHAVGWGREDSADLFDGVTEDPILRTSEAWSICYSTLYDVAFG